MNRCLFCHKPIAPGKDFHPECSRKFFRTSTPPTFDYGIEEIEILGEKFELNDRQIKNTFAMFSENEFRMTDEIKNSYLNAGSKKSYIKLIKSRLLVFK